MNREIICNPNAFTPSQRSRYEELRELARRATGEVREIDNGFILHFSMEPTVLATVAEWIALERLCCPFLDFELQLVADRTFAALKMTGPDPTKEILREGIAAELFSPQRLVKR